MLNSDINLFFKTGIETPNDVRQAGRTVLDRNIVAIIPRGEVIRNFIYTGALDYVSENARLSLVSVSPSETMNRMLKETYGDVHPLEDFEERWIVRVQREIIGTAHNRWLWSKAAQERARLRDTEAGTVKQKIVRKIKKAVSYPLANQPALKALSTIERTSSRFFRTTDE